MGVVAAVGRGPGGDRVVQQRAAPLLDFLQLAEEVGPFGEVQGIELPPEDQLGFLFVVVRDRVEIPLALGQVAVPWERLGTPRSVTSLFELNLQHRELLFDFRLSFSRERSAARDESHRLQKCEVLQDTNSFV